MLDPKCKSMRLMITYLGREAVATLVADYDEQLLLLLLEVYKGLLPNRRDYLDEFASFVDSHDLFVETNKTINTYKDIVCYKLSSFHQYFVDAKTFSCALTWWWMEKQKFPIVLAVARLIFGIPASQVEIERIVSIFGILTTLKRCRLQINNMDKLIFVNKNQSFDLHVGCLKLFDLATICEAESNLTNELDVEFMDEVKHEEYVDGDLQLLEVFPYM